MYEFTLPQHPKNTHKKYIKQKKKKKTRNRERTSSPIEKSTDPKSGK